MRGTNPPDSHRSDVMSIISVELTLILFLAWKKYADTFANVYSKRGINYSVSSVTPGIVLEKFLKEFGKAYEPNLE
jgi:hypothetical protein